MFANSGRTRGLLGAAAASIFTLGLGAVTGIVPRAGDLTTIRAAEARPFSLTDPLAVPVEVVTDSPTTLATEPPVTDSTESTVDTPPEPQAVAEPVPHPVVESETVAEPAPMDEAQAPAPPPAPPAVERRQPSIAEIAQAIAGVRPYVKSLLPLSPSRDQVVELGDKICTAFDEGQTVDQIKATGAELVKKVPFASLREGGADYIVRTGVALFCPGHASKLP